jgi:hypothetical protein
LYERALKYNMKKLSNPKIKKLPDYVYMGLGMALSNACDELENGQAIYSKFKILTPIGEVLCTLEKRR